MDPSVIRQKQASAKKSWFIPFWGWLFVLVASFFLFISIMPNIYLYHLQATGSLDGATIPAHNQLEVVFYSNLPVFAGLFSFLCLLWLLGAIGLLRRRRWSGTLLSVVLGLFLFFQLAVLVNFLVQDYEITAWRDPERNRRFASYFPWALAGGSALFGWLIYRLNATRVTEKLV
ncbi:hypothetical protein [Robiginitalea sp. SC105]|uniref:hypothetical protein n=1 Tax=Robiginitalea sp. SC105 TaxID=2762332 RepID=UPI001C8D975B|nr:hypothetical protein [Robiginitalea sp. SC105]